MSDLRDDASGGLHIFPVFVAEFIDEHLLLLRDPEIVEQCPCRNAEDEDERVVENDALPDYPEPDVGIHRVPDSFVDPGFDEGVVLFDLEYGRPVLPEVGMNPGEQPDVEEPDYEEKESY